MSNTAKMHRNNKHFEDMFGEDNNGLVKKNSIPTDRKKKNIRAQCNKIIWANDF